MFLPKIHAWLLRRWYGDRPVGILIPLAFLFSALAAVRRWCYRLGFFRVVKFPVPVIVIGNITVGGSGKTPFVIWLTRVLQNMGYLPGIITRGYGGKSTQWPLLVTPQTDPFLSGDEAVLLAEHTLAPVSAAPDRVQAARYLLQQGNVNVIVSDDGLQHYSLGRDLTVIMLDGERLLGNGWRLPAGPLRESKHRLQDADLVICKMIPGETTTPPFNTALVMHLSLEEAVNITDDRRLSLADFAGQRVHAFAAIGNPRQFFKTLSNYGLQVDWHAFPDHAHLSEAQLTFADNLPVLMTEKDAIKYRGLKLPNHWYVPAIAEFSEINAAHIESTIRQILKSKEVEVENSNV